MRFAYLTSQYPGISHTFIQREVAQLRQRGLDIHTFSVRRPIPEDLLTDVDRAEFRNTYYILPPSLVRLVFVHVWSLFTHPWDYLRTFVKALKLRTAGLVGLFKWMSYFAEGILLASELRRRKIDHLHNHFANPSANVAMLAAHFLDLRWSFVLHGIHEMETDGVGRIRDKIALANFVICICDFNRSQAMRMSNFSDWPKLHLARCGVDIRFFESESVKDDGERPFRILTVARLFMDKGIPGLLAAFHRVLDSGIDAELRVVGDGPERPLVEAEIQRLGIADRCTLLGRRAGRELADEYPKADVFALASFMEGLPVVLMEAMASKVPVVAPWIAGIPELVVHEQCGLLYAPARWDQLADAIIRLKSDPELRDRLTAAGRIRVEEQHAIETAVEPIAELLVASASENPHG